MKFEGYDDKKTGTRKPAPFPSMIAILSGDCDNSRPSLNRLLNDLPKFYGVLV